MKCVRNRLEIEKSEFCTRYTGTKEELIAAGVAGGVTFPVWPKRTTRNCFRDTPQDQRYGITYRKGGRFTLKRWHDPKESRKEPAPWDPAAFKVSLLGYGRVFSLFLLDQASGACEHFKCGNSKATHRLSAADLDKLRALQCQITNVINKATIERCDGGSLLQLVK